MNQDTVKRLISELLSVDGMMVVMDSGGAVSEMSLIAAPDIEFEGRWATIEARDWHIHLDMQQVAGAQFVENSHHGHKGIPKLYYARLSDAAGDTLLRFYFPNPWLDADENPTPFQPAKLRAFEAFRARYANIDGVALVQRTAEGDIYQAQACGDEGGKADNKAVNKEGGDE